VGAINRGSLVGLLSTSSISRGAPISASRRGDSKAPPSPAQVLASARSRLLSAHTGTPGITYMVAGDSTRDNNYNQMIDYYGHQLGKANVALFDNASSGQSGQDWSSLADSPNVSEAIAATAGAGENTILEYSFGINDDKNGATRAQVKSWLLAGLNTYRAARPDAAIILVVPLATAVTARNENLQSIYFEMGAELGLPVIDLLPPMLQVHGNTDFYQDSTHPNRNGSIRAVNFILSELVPPELYGVIDLDTVFLNATPPSTEEMAGPVEAGYWSSSTGAPVTNTAWRRMQEIAVEPNFVLRIAHGGNRYDTAFFDDTGAFVATVSSTVVSGQSRTARSRSRQAPGVPASTSRPLDQPGTPQEWSPRSSMACRRLPRSRRPRSTRG
jgi:hypothetical protein